MATIQDILGGNLPSGLLSPEQEAMAQQRAQSAGLTNLGFALLQASQGQRGQPKPSLGQIIGQAGPVGMQAYQGSFDDTLKRALQGMQIGEMRRKQQESEQLRTLLPQVFRTTRGPSTTETIASEQGDDVLTRPGAVTGVSIDPAKLQALMMIPGGAEAVKGLAETQKLVRQAGLGVGGTEVPSPFAIYLTAQSPEVRKLAETYDKGFKSGTIDEETAYKRIESLGRMEDSYVARVESRQKESKPTEGERKTSTLAGRLEQALTDLQKIEKEKPAALKPEVIPSLLQSGILSYIPGAEMVAGKWSSEDRLRAEAAQLDALDAALTLGTGAAYTKEQLRGYARAYFPQIGDTPAVIAEKNARFANIVRLARSQSGSAYAGPAPATSTPDITNVRSRYNLEGAK